VSCVLRPCKYLNNVLEQDQRCVKHCGHSGLGVGAFHTAQRTIQGYETMPMIRKGQLVGIDKRDVLHLLGLAETLEQVVGVSPEALRQRTVEALWQLSLQGSRRQPLILAIEDVQWVDPSSEALFIELSARLADAPILFVVTYRPGYRPPWLGQSYATQLALGPLAPQESLGVVRAVCQNASPPEPVLQTILARAEGNPLFLEELTRALLEQGNAPAAVAVPATLQGVLLARIDRLPPALARLLGAELLYQRGRATARNVSLQACAYPRGGLSNPTERSAAAGPSADRPGIGGGLECAGHSLLAASRRAGCVANFRS
jgi:hypothetical protein